MSKLLIKPFEDAFNSSIQLKKIENKDYLNSSNQSSITTKNNDDNSSLLLEENSMNYSIQNENEYTSCLINNLISNSSLKSIVYNNINKIEDLTENLINNININNNSQF